jgi:hypothetical protein
MRRDLPASLDSLARIATKQIGHFGQICLRAKIVVDPQHIDIEMGRPVIAALS